MFKMIKMTYLRTLAMLLMVAIMSFAFYGCYFLPKEEEVLAPPIKQSEKISYETVNVKKGTIERKIICTGTFVSVSQKDLVYKEIGGRLKALMVKNGDNIKKGDVVAELETDSVENDIKLQEIAVKKSQIIFDRIKTHFDIEGGGDKSDLDLAELDLESNQLILDNLRTELEHSRLVSPIDGVVVYIADIKLAEYVNAYQTLVRVADPAELQLEYSEDRVSDFKLGTKPDIKIDNNTYMGIVVITPSNMPSDASEDQRKSIRIKVDKLPKNVNIGDTATISLTLEKRDNVIVLPKRLVNYFEGRKFVNVLKNGIREERDVELGLQSDTEVEVQKGLDVGEQIIVR